MAEIVSMPKLGFDMAEGTLVRWVLAEGEAVSKGAILAEIETDKATVEVESNFGGMVLRHLVEAGTVVPVNTPIAVIGEAGEKVDVAVLAGEETPKAADKAEAKPVEVAPAPKPVETIAEEGKLPGGVRATPLARRLAEEKGINLRNVAGSGPKGRIQREDVEAHLVTGVKALVPLFEAVPTVEGEPREDQRIPLSKLRAIIGRRMAESTRQVPHFFVTHEYDMAAVMALRSEVNALLPEDEKTSVNDYIVKAVALALWEFPNLNATLDEGKGEVVRHGRINVGVAVAVENGLLTVVCRDTNLKTIRKISNEVRGMVDRAREGKVRPEDIEGSTLSVSNLGMFDVEHFTAIINPPEAAILAVGSVRQVAVVVDGELRPGTRMKATLSVDHRVSDGVEAARFLQAVAKYLEQPMLLVI